MSHLLTERDVMIQLGYDFAGDLRADIKAGLAPEPTHGNTKRPRWTTHAIADFVGAGDALSLEEETAGLRGKIRGVRGHASDG